jgi:colicin import membrane protein
MANRPHQVSVTLRFLLARDGALDGEPAVVQFRASPVGAAAAKAAMAAVAQCAPYRLPAADYEAWKDVQLKLAP